MKNEKQIDCIHLDPCQGRNKCCNDKVKSNRCIPDCGEFLRKYPQNKKPDAWQQVEQDFIEWDNETHSNASQRQILDWFKNKFA